MGVLWSTAIGCVSKQRNFVGVEIWLVWSAFIRLARVMEVLVVAVVFGSVMNGLRGSGAQNRNEDTAK